MYSLILMTAMAGSPQSAEFNGFFRDLLGFRGGCRGSCSGGGSGSRSESSGCTGSRNSAGCSGSCSGDRPARSYAGGSCYGSCSGRSSSGSSCCGGSLSYASCGGGGGGMSPGFSDPGMGTNGFATPSPAVSYYLPESGGGCLGSGAPAPFNFPESGGGYAQPSATPPSSVSEDRYRANVLPSPSAGQGDANRAAVVVRLPADATLYAEGRRLNLTSDTRRFVSPPLPSNGDFTYNFRVEYARNGETISRTKSVSVRAGGQFSVDFDEALTGRPAPLAPQPMPSALPATVTTTATPAPTVPAPAATPVSVPNPVPGKSSAPERAKITVRLSRGATLYVDGRKNDRTEFVREFTTPPLVQGAEYAYLMKAEISRNGQPESQTVKVTFRAGEIQTVDLTQWPTGTERAGN